MRCPVCYACKMLAVFACHSMVGEGRNLAIAEWPTDSMSGNGGYVDYALFIGEKMVGVIEAKKKHTNISSVLDGQCKEYARRIKEEHEKYVMKQYGEYKVPFLFATNGRDYIKQYEEMSGIWFLDTRQQFNTSKALAGWPSPEGLEQDLERDIAEADRKLAATGYELLEDSNGLGLRYYQIEAVKAAEKAIAEQKNTVLLAMATGTGKTRTVLGMIYRFLSAKRFKRILYLVDRTALGDQTMDAFKEVKLEDLKTLNQLYDIKDLGEKEFEKDTCVHIATVQSLVKRILYNETDVSIGVSDYDCIIVDDGRDIIGTNQRKPVYCPDGGRHKGGMNFTQASVRNVGTHGLMLREYIKRKDRKIRVPMQSWGQIGL